MVDAGVTIEEARWLEEESARHATQQDTPREDALQYCRRLVGRYGGADQLANLPLEDAGPCTDCNTTVEARYRIGKVTVCRHDAVLRLRAQRHADAPIAAALTPRRSMPADLHAYVAANARNLTTSTLRAQLRDWRINDDYAIELLDLAYDLAHQSEAAA